MLVGYMRVSSSDDRQTVDLQRDALTAVGVDSRHLHQDKASGARDDRPGLKACLDDLRQGDVLVVWKLDRLGRSLPHLLAIVTDLKQRGVAFRSLTEQMDTTTPHGELLFGIFGALAQYERALTQERVVAAWPRPSAGAARAAGGPPLTRSGWRASLPHWRVAQARPACAAASRCRARRCWTLSQGRAGAGRPTTHQGRTVWDQPAQDGGLRRKSSRPSRPRPCSASTKRELISLIIADAGHGAAVVVGQHDHGPATQARGERPLA